MEDYCNFETAKLLKEKGFNIPTHTFYNPKKSYMVKFDPCLIDRNAGTCVSAPTHAIAMKYLREIYGLHITIKPYITTEGIMYAFEIYKLESDRFTLLKSKAGFEKSEEAVDAAIKYCLEKLI